MSPLHLIKTPTTLLPKQNVGTRPRTVDEAQTADVAMDEAGVIVVATEEVHLYGQLAGFQSKAMDPSSNNPTNAPGLLLRAKHKGFGLGLGWVHENQVSRWVGVVHGWSRGCVGEGRCGTSESIKHQLGNFSRQLNFKAMFAPSTIGVNQQMVSGDQHPAAATVTSQERRFKSVEMMLEDVMSESGMEEEPGDEKCWGHGCSPLQNEETESEILRDKSKIRDLKSFDRPRKCRRELGFRSFDDQNVWLNRRCCSSSSHHRSRKWGFKLDCMDSDGDEEDDERSSKLEKRVLGFSGWTGVEERTL
ncbi:hypothetical protein E3N88_43775 [Mikania micrantha]|uniref:Uncharacterized protein n=1 Tax=Mikania micrantha TaxID=192012 RepID=A0A5N6LDY9_9ASTR|nr:hypothetical protein E3N88_43775 [Mikania micrantha]